MAITSIFFIRTMLWGNILAERAVTQHEIVMPQEISEVNLGMSVESFVKIHPLAKSMDYNWMEGEPPKTIDLKAETIVLFEEWKNGNALNQAGYAFLKGKLVAVTLLGESGLVYKTRSELLETYMKLWGTNFEKHAEIFRKSSKFEYLSPYIIWQFKDAFVIFKFPPKTEKKSSSKSLFTLLISNSEEHRKNASRNEATDLPKRKFETLFESTGVNRIKKKIEKEKLKLKRRQERRK